MRFLSKLLFAPVVAVLRFEGLEMHAACLRPSNLALGQNLSPNMLYSLRACSRKNRGETQQFQTWGIKRNIWSVPCVVRNVRKLGLNKGYIQT